MWRLRSFVESIDSDPRLGDVREGAGCGLDAGKLS
jgi:hypothetical protein